MVVERLTKKTISGDKIRELWEKQAKKWAKSRETILYCRAVEDGSESFVREGWAPSETQTEDPLMPRLPQRDLLPRKQVNKLGANPPIIERKAAGGQSLRAKENAESAEQFMQAAIDASYDFDSSVGLSLDGQWAAIIQPSPSYLLNAPDFITAQLSSKEYDDTLKDFMAQNPPWVCRLISATDCVPILTRGYGNKKFAVESLLVRSTYDVETLLSRNYIWSPKEEQPLLVPSGYSDFGTEDSDGRIYLYEYWRVWDGHPCVTYSVAGCDTKKDGSDFDGLCHTIDLYEEYGIGRLHVGYFFGLHRERDDPAERGVPYLYPVGSLLVSTEAMLGAISVDTCENAFTGHILHADKETSPQALMENGQPRRIRKPAFDEILMLPGEVSPFGQAKVGDDAWRILGQELALIGGQTDDQQASDASGHAMVVSDELERQGHRQIGQALIESVEFAASAIAEICATMARGKWKVLDGKGVNVTLHANVDADPSQEDGRPGVIALEFNERWIGQTYAFKARFPNRGNLAEIQQIMDLWQKGAATLEDVLEARGKTSTLFEAAKILNDQISRSPQAQLELLAYAARIRGDKEKAKALELQFKGELTQAGMPIDAVDPEALAAAAAGTQQRASQAAPQAAQGPQSGMGQALPGSLPGGPGAGASTPGVQLPNIGASMLGGITGGAIGGGAMLNDAMGRIQAGAGQSGSGL